MAEKAVEQRGVSIALACRAFGLSETCFRYSPKRKAENDRIGDLLIGLTHPHKTWGFGLCFLHLRNVKGYPWNHKRVYRIYRELKLNLRIKPRKRLVREKPDELAVPEAPNRTWSMDFMADRLSDGRAFLPIPTKAPVCNGIMPPGDSGIMAPSCNGMIPPGRRVS